MKSDTGLPKIPLQRPCLGQAELDAVAEVFASGELALGRYTRRFEQRLARMLGDRHVVAVNTGTSALHLALEALQLSRGDEVILPSQTFVASVQAVLAAGLKPVFCEVCADSQLMDIDDALARLTDRTRVIMPVHYAGQLCAMDRLYEQARRRGLRIVEDAAHAFGSRDRSGRLVGSVGDLVCFSFDAIKNITCGEGGAIVAADERLAHRLRCLRRLGIEPPTDPARPWSYQVTTTGWRYHLPNTNAAIGLAQLDRADAMYRDKRAIVRRYDRAFAPIPGLALLPHDDRAFPFFYVVRVLDGRRAELIDHLRRQAIGCGIHYPPNHLQPLCRDFRTDLPITERTAGEILTLPMFGSMTDTQVNRVIEAVCGFYQTG